MTRCKPETDTEVDHPLVRNTKYGVNVAGASPAEGRDQSVAEYSAANGRASSGDVDGRIGDPDGLMRSTGHVHADNAYLLTERAASAGLSRPAPYGSSETNTSAH